MQYHPSKSFFLAVVVCSSVLLLGLIRPARQASGLGTAVRYTVAVYDWPCYHPSKFMQAKLGKGWTEWDLIKKAKARFPGQYQPKVPLWGYTNEANPRVMAHAIAAMADHGVNVIIFDWYRFQHNKSILESALRAGFLKAPNHGRLKFALMWANGSFGNIFPFKPGETWSNVPVWLHAAVDRRDFDRITRSAIHYFKRPDYWKINGKPYFSIYDLPTLIRGLGGVAATHAALEHFRAEARAAGFPGLDMNVIIKPYDLPHELALVKGQPMPGDPSQRIETVAEMFHAFGFNSGTLYTWAQQVAPEYPTESYRRWGADAVAGWPADADYGIPFYPNVTVGWDGTPRHYPGGVVLHGSPRLFKAFLVRAKAWDDRHPSAARVVTINAWNEWAEGSHLEPDVLHGMGYLDAVRSVFPPHK
ncbi:MAG: glycoside hydrolase family 99-like domain-containing protein [Phycisphaerae bacterium]